MITRIADKKFELVSPYAPAGDQPQAIAKLTKGFKAGKKRADLAGGHGDWEDLHHEQRHREPQ
ncbi:hypothetical protein [Lacticaseibacillus camelliae]|uniref:hypothetical protein n=1 Tax=Lacticaseibacillus camelliae TaxID=381742 RepID=UPI000AA32424